MFDIDSDIVKQAPTVAAMDLGTNSNRLLIADLSGNAVYRDVKHVALGDGLAMSGEFCKDSMERGICSFMDFAEMMPIYNVKAYRAIATAACRMSSNASLFIDEVKKSSGIDIEVISEFEEARLTLAGARLNATEDKPFLIVYDLGGGSTEITLAKNMPNAEIIATVSIPLGARNATEIFGLTEYNKDGAEKLRLAVMGYMRDFLEKISLYDIRNNASLIATSSTPLRLVSAIYKFPEYDKFKSDGLKVNIDDLDKIIAEILPLSAKERAKNPHIGINRVGIFTAACLIFQTIYRALGMASLTASLKSAQEAIIAELIAQYPHNT